MFSKFQEPLINKADKYFDESSVQVLHKLQNTYFA